MRKFIATRRKNHKLVTFYKMSNNLSPQYLVDLLPESIQNRYTLCDNNNAPLIHCRSSLYKDSFLSSVICDWNSLPESTRASRSLHCFKHNLRSNSLKPRSYYSVGSRIGQLLHTRLRLNCSSLNHDLFRKSIIENPLCSCGRDRLSLSPCQPKLYQYTTTLHV